MDGCAKCTIEQGIINSELVRIRKAERQGRTHRIPPIVDRIQEAKARAKKCAAEGHEAGVTATDHASQSRYGHNAVFTAPRIDNAKTISCPDCYMPPGEPCQQIHRSSHNGTTIGPRVMQRPHKARIFLANPDMEVPDGVLG